MKWFFFVLIFALNCTGSCLLAAEYVGWSLAAFAASIILSIVCNRYHLLPDDNE